MLRVLSILHRYWSEDPVNQEKFPVFASIDGTHPRTLVVAVSLRESLGLQVIHNKQVPTVCSQRRKGYCFLASHYKMLLQLFFTCLQAPRLIMLEEDLAIAPDFFPYMAAAAAVMDRDHSIWCVSAWNDHGQLGRARNGTALYRTDVLPGLGWMMPARVGQRIWREWPRSNWDDWMRMRSIRQNRQCIFPEVPRTHTFGKIGTSEGEHYDTHLKEMLLSEERVDWKNMVSKLGGGVMGIVNGCSNRGYCACRTLHDFNLESFGSRCCTVHKLCSDVSCKVFLLVLQDLSY